VKKIEYIGRMKKMNKEEIMKNKKKVVKGMEEIKNENK
jgi:hypothetical protein